MSIGRSTGAMKNLYKQAQSQIPAVISIPPTWLRSYEDFVTKNASQVSQIESALRSLTYIIPGRFRESELASESLHATIQLLSLYHTSLLRHPTPHPTPHTRYTSHFTNTSRPYARSALLLQTVQYTELLCEMFAKRRGGEQLRWRLVVVTEFFKAICRIVMLRVTGTRMLVTPPLAERGALPPDENDDPDSPDKEWKMPRTGSPLPPLPANDSIPTFLSTRVLSADDIKFPSSLIRRLATSPAQIAEYLYILRPVIYALAMQRFQSNKRDWRPWALGLVIEVGARQLQKREMQRQPWAVTGLEREEMAKRRWGIGWWLMRGVFYEDVTRSWISSLTDKMKGKPLLDMLTTIVEDYEFLWDEYYFATSSM